MFMPRLFTENLFDGFYDDFNTPARRNFFYTVPADDLMKTDVKETDTGYALEIELPGYKKEDIKAQLKDGYMTISASKSENKDEKNEDGKYVRRERYVGNSSRSFYVGENVTEEDIKAKFEDGILKLEVPKKQPVPKVEEKKYITIA